MHRIGDKVWVVVEGINVVVDGLPWFEAQQRSVIKYQGTTNIEVIDDRTKQSSVHNIDDVFLDEEKARECARLWTMRIRICHKITPQALDKLMSRLQSEDIVEWEK